MDDRLQVGGTEDVKMQNPDHCLFQLLPAERSTTNLLRKRGHNFELYGYNYEFFSGSLL